MSTHLKVVMSMSKQPKTVREISLYPSMDSTKSVLDMALAQYPIINQNQLIALLQTMKNTVLYEAGLIKQD